MTGTSNSPHECEFEMPGWHIVVQLGGFEPPTSGSTDRRSNQLSYSCTMTGHSASTRHDAKP